MTMTDSMHMTANGQKQRAGRIALRVDAQQALEQFQADFEKFAEFDPHVAWVREALAARFSEIPEDDAIRVAAVLWPGLKARMVPDICPTDWPPSSWPPPTLPERGRGISLFPWDASSEDGSLPRPLIDLRHGLVEGQLLRRLVEAALTSGPLTVDALRKTAQDIKDWEYSADSGRTREFSQAHDEVKRMATGVERKGFAIGVAVGVAAAEVAWHHVKAK